MAFFCLLESLVGGEVNFQPFLQAYFEKFAGRTVTSEKMRDYFLEYFATKAAEDAAIAAALEGPIAILDWEKLWRAPGMPDYLPPCSATPIEEAERLACRWQEAGASAENLTKFSAADIEGWGTTKLIVFLDCFLDSKDGGGGLPPAACERMADVYKFLTANCELRGRFLRVCLAAKWAGAQDSAVEFATMQGRMKFTRPFTEH